MSKIQMAVLDLDGTLLDAAGRLSQRERQAVRRAVELSLIHIFAVLLVITLMNVLRKKGA